MRMTRDEFIKTFGKPEQQSKYRNRKCEWNGMTFDSIRERDRYIELEFMQRSGEISELNRQQKFLLIPDQMDNGKVVEKACHYIADFTYYDKDGKYIVEDVKGIRTKEYRLKRKMMMWFQGLRISEV